MNAFIPGYDGISRLCIVSRTQKTTEDLLNRNASVLFVQDDSIVFLPDSVRLPLETVSQSRLSLLREFDIVEIGPQGVLYRSFANEEPDATLFMGGGCNSNCIMCPASDTERKKAFAYQRETLLKYIDFLPDDLEYLVITGGEPTLNPALFLEALECVQHKFPYTNVLLLTNGRSFSNRSFFDETYQRLPNRFRVAIPIHGANAAEHDAITQAEHSFEQTMQGIQRFLRASVPVEIRVVVTKANAGSLLSIADLISRHFPQCLCVNFIGLEPRGNCAKNFDQVFITYSDSFRASRPAIDYLIACGINVGLYNYPLCHIDKNYWSLACQSISSYKNVFLEACDVCAVKDICTGFFTAAKHIAHPTAFPVRLDGDSRV